MVSALSEALPMTGLELYDQYSWLPYLGTYTLYFLPTTYLLLFGAGLLRVWQVLYEFDGWWVVWEASPSVARGKCHTRLWLSKKIYLFICDYLAFLLQGVMGIGE